MSHSRCLLQHESVHEAFARSQYRDTMDVAEFRRFNTRLARHVRVLQHRLVLGLIIGAHRLSLFGLSNGLKAVQRFLDVLFFAPPFVLLCFHLFRTTNNTSVVGTCFLSQLQVQSNPLAPYYALTVKRSDMKKKLSGRMKDDQWVCRAPPARGIAAGFSAAASAE